MRRRSRICAVASPPPSVLAFRDVGWLPPGWLGSRLMQVQISVARGVRQRPENRPESRGGRLSSSASKVRIAMLRTNITLLALALGVLPSAASVVPARGSELESASVSRGTIHFDEGLWGRGSLPSLTFTVVTGRGRPEKVACFLYYSE